MAPSTARDVRSFAELGGVDRLLRVNNPDLPDAQSVRECSQGDTASDTTSSRCSDRTADASRSAFSGRHAKDVSSGPTGNRNAMGRKEAVTVHDLLWISKDTELFSLGQPAWVREVLTRSSVVVVRRADAAPGFIAVGIRGSSRGQRHAAFLRKADVLAYRTPESLGRRTGMA